MTKEEIYRTMVSLFQGLHKESIENYWQGGIGHLQADVLIIGDDWSSFEGNNQECLCELMGMIGYPLKENNPEVFCANLSIPGDIAKEEQAVFEYLRQLIILVEPKAVLCLGKVTFEAVFQCFGMELPVRLKKEGFNHMIDRNNVGYYLCFGKNNEKKKVRVFALPRLTSMGITCRNFKGEHEDEMYWIKEDFKKIGTFLAK